MSYIKRENALELSEILNVQTQKYGIVNVIDVVPVDAILSIPAADVQEVVRGQNITEENPVDQFICSRCGLILEEYVQKEIDPDDGDATYYELEPLFCPRCGADVREEKKAETPRENGRTIKFVLDGCDISFNAEAPEDITLAQLLKQCDRISPDWCACGIRSAKAGEFDKAEITIGYDSITKNDPDVSCQIVDADV